MDYDRSDVASVYDEARAVVPETLRLWREILSTHLDPSAVSLVVDVGCGTGRFSEVLAAHFEARVVAIDPSQRMLDQARPKLTSGRVALLRGSAAALPLLDGSADLVFMSMVYHHLAEPILATKESHRVLHKFGHVCVRNTTRESDFPHRHFFPGIQTLIDSQLPTSEDVTTSFAAAGFAPVVHRVVTQVIAPDWAGFVHKSSLRADSFLARLSEEDFDSGMAELRARAEETNPGHPVTEEIDWFVFSKQA